VLYRQVAEMHRPDYERLMSSGLYAELVGQGQLISHEEVDVGLALSPPAAFVLRPELVPFISYPYEWGWAQLRDAALVTLSIQAAALVQGMTLRDASAFNITFHQGRPVMLDTTSLGIWEPGTPWVAYRQFCQHFLAPLALMSYRDQRLGRLQRTYLDGIPLDLAASLLPARARARPGLAMHIRMHAGSQRRHENDEAPARVKAFSPRAFEGLIDSLRSSIRSLPEPSVDSAWRDYYGQAEHYSDEAAKRKEELVAEWLDAIEPSSVWDLGANTGRFSVLATTRGVDTVAFDFDSSCVDELYRSAAAREDDHMTAVVMDLANPTPGLGWGGHERTSLEDRGPADVVLALAVVHHLAIANNVPLVMILEWFSRLAHHAIVEFVPKHDQKVQRLLRDREDVFDAYSTEGFESAATSAGFRVGQREQVGDSGRTLYLLERR
jgi:hypothetical protein